MAEIAIRTGPSSRLNASFWRDARDPDRFVIQRRRGVVTQLAAIPLLAIAALLQRSLLSLETRTGLVLLGLVPGIVGALLLFGRGRFVLDRRSQSLSWQLVLGGNWPRWTRSIESVKAVRLDELVEPASSDDDSDTTFFVVSLELSASERIELARSGSWESLLPLAEGVSAFTKQPLFDYVIDSLREPDELDVPLLQRERQEKALAPEPPGDSRCEVVLDGAITRLTFPPPDAKPVLALVAFVALLWTVPVFLSGGVVVSLLPLVLLGWIWFQVRFGFRSSAEIEGSTLRVRRQGLIVERIHEFPAAALEDLAVRTVDRGASRNIIATVTDGYLIARSDTGHVRFGWGLELRDLEWLREYILTVLEPPATETPRRVPEDDIPVGRPSWLMPLVGLFAGAMVARASGGRLELCLAVPFLEHVINVGGLIGLAIGAYLADRTSSRFRFLVWGSVVLLGAAVFYRSHPLLQPFPTYDEGMLGRMGRPPFVFWIGGTFTAALANTFVASCIIAIAGRFRSREPQAEPASGRKKARRPVDPARQDKIARVALFIFGLPFFVGSLFIFYAGLTENSSNRAMTLLGSIAFLVVGLGMMQVWRLVPKRYWPTGIEWNAMIGVLAASGSGLFIIGVSIFGDDSGMNAPRPVVAAAGAVFLLAGVAILPQAIPRLAGGAELVTKAAVSMLLTAFTAVAVWATIAGSWVFILGALLTGFMAFASWATLIRDLWNRRKRQA